MPLRLAVVIRGAVSLGSYEAGVLYEVLRAIEKYNNLQADPEQKIEIDVLVGASAGSVTAAITSHVLSGGRDRLRSAEDNPFYDLWVKDLDVAQLVRLREGDVEAAALLSGAFIDELAQRYLGQAPVGAPHSAAPRNRPIRLAFALSNLRGLDYDPVTEGVSFRSTRFQDEWRGEVPVTGNADWAAVRTAAVGSGSFPAAFPVRGIRRQRTEYNTTYLSKDDWPESETSRVLPYVDGGVFNNEPLGLAKECVDEVDHHRDNERRSYLFVSPSPKESKSGPDFPASGATILQMAGRLITAVIGQAQYQDLAALRKTNQKVVALDRLADALARQLEQDPAGAVALAQAAPTVAAAAFESAKPPQENLVQATARLLELYRVEAARFTSPARRDTWVMLLAAFERSATLQEKDYMRLMAVCAEDSELLGDPLVHFGGFTSQAVRRYDYEVGRAKAQAWLTPAAGQPANPLGLSQVPLAFEPVNLPAARQAAVAQLRERAGPVAGQLGDRVGEHLNGVMQRAGIWWLVRAPVRAGVSALVAWLIRHELLQEADSPAPGIGGHGAPT